MSEAKVFKNRDCRVTQDEMKGASTDQKPTNGGARNSDGRGATAISEI
jgi:hypothetical protein